MIPRHAVARFWHQVDTTGDCWLWTGRLNGAGYGYMSVGGCAVGVHVIGCELQHGDMPPGMQACHTCQHRHCVRHVYAGTSLDNNRDLMASGRHNPRSGDTHPSRFHLHPVQRSPEALASSEFWKTSRRALGLTQKRLAAELGCTLISISNAERGVHVPGGRLLTKLHALLEQSRALRTSLPAGERAHPYVT